MVTERHKQNQSKLLKVSASVKNLSITPRKVRLVTDLIANKPIPEAIGILENTPKRSALPILKLLNSAVANATNNYKLNFNNLKIDEIFVNEGMKLKRSRPRARGMSYPIWKRYSHVYIALVSQQEEVKQEKSIVAKRGKK